MGNMFARRLLGGGTIAAILGPLVLNFLIDPPVPSGNIIGNSSLDGPFEILDGDRPGPPRTIIARGRSFGWKFHFCLLTDDPGIEIRALRRVSDGAVIGRSADVLMAGPDHCVQGTGTAVIPADAPPGAYEITRNARFERPDNTFRSVALQGVLVEVLP